MTQEWLKEAISGERNAIAMYQNMKMLTGDQEHLETLGRIIEDEETHLLGLEGLLRRGKPGGESPVTESDLGCVFTECLRRAIGKELETEMLYRSAYVSDGSEFFFNAMTDENAHAVLLNRMYTREVEKRLL
ncbi:MAG: hypothetical protein LBR76_08415 [Oscillospiraceae bacterium]|jgi:rubrerythrin|nr:hypothetical protein [Oscillospiraceae bacterium]